MPPIPSQPYRLFNEDCLTVLPRLAPGSVDLVLADPPYGTTQAKWDSIIPLGRLWPALRKVIKFEGVVVLNCGQPFTSELVVSNREWFRYDWVWEKEPSGNLNAKHRPMSAHESVLVFCSGKGTYNPQDLKPTLRKRSSADISKTQVYGAQSSKGYVQTLTGYPQSLLSFSKGKNNTHPTQKPVELMEYLVKTYSNEGDTVLDFSMGSGTTGVACGLTGRKFIGCENDTEHGYFETARRRIEEAYASR